MSNSTYHQLRRRSAPGWAVGGHRVLAPLLVAAGLLILSPGRAAEDLLRQGNTLLQERRWQEAERFFQEAVGRDPSSGDARHGLGSARAALGHQALREGNWIEARRKTEEAIQVYPDDPAFHLLLAMILYRQGDYSYSRFSVRRALALDPEEPQALELLGDLLYQEGYLDLAVPEWERALTRSPSPDRLRAKMEKARAERAVEDSYHRNLSRHFIIQYDGPVSAWVGQVVLDHLEEAFDDLRRELGTAPQGDITVILYGHQVFHRVTGSPFWVGGRFDGKIRVPVGGIATKEEAQGLVPILRHELSHAFSRSMVPRGLPLWLEEGMAEYFEGVTADMAAGVARGRAQGFPGLEALNHLLRDPGGDIGQAYAAAGVAFWTLVERHGWHRIRRILERMGEGAGFPEALVKETGVDLEEFQEAWRSRMRQ
jgi:tetratricopeptide (TPR) repeat protein